MRAVGIVAEYNPFHNGHRYHLQEAKRRTGRDAAVVVMSGQFTQRGEPALTDKWTRTRMALEGGADVVLELPLCFACASAAIFAGGAVRLLGAAGIADCLAFGSESGDLAGMKAAARVLHEEPPAYKEALRAALSRGLPFAAAREEAAVAADARIPRGLLSGANDTLGVEYLRALAETGAEMEAVSVKRVSGAYVPASTIRAWALAGRADEAAAFMPPESFALLRSAAEDGALADLDRYTEAFRYILRVCPEAVGRAADAGEGLANRFARLGAGFASLHELLAAVKTKRYAYTRLQRVALHTLLGLDGAAIRAAAASGPPYIRVLGFKKESASWLGALDRYAKLPVLVNLKHAPRVLTGEGLAALERETAATDLYAIAARRTWPARYEYRVPVVTV